MARELLATSKIHDIVRQVACDKEVGIDEEAAKFLVEVTKEFVDSVSRYASVLAHHRSEPVPQLTVKDLRRCLDKVYDIRVPNFDEVEWEQKRAEKRRKIEEAEEKTRLEQERRRQQAAAVEAAAAELAKAAEERARAEAAAARALEQPQVAAQATPTQPQSAPPPSAAPVAHGTIALAATATPSRAASPSAASFTPLAQVPGMQRVPSPNPGTMMSPTWAAQPSGQFSPGTFSPFGTASQQFQHQTYAQPGQAASPVSYMFAKGAIAQCKHCQSKQQIPKPTNKLQCWKCKKTGQDFTLCAPKAK